MKRQGRSWMRAGLLLAAVAVAAGGWGWAQAPDLSRMDLVLRAVPDGPVALVNGRPVSDRDFRELYVRELDRMELRGMALDDNARVQAGMRILGGLIQTEILLQEAERRKIGVADAELDQAYQKAMKYMQGQLGDGGNLSEEEVLKRAETTREQVRNELRRELLVEKMTETIMKEKGVTVSDADVDKFVKEHQPRGEATRYRIRHLLIKPQTTRGKVTPEDLAKARQKAETALNTIRSGRSFESVTKEVSDGPRKEQGGDLGFLAAQEMPPFIASAVQSLQPGQMSGVIESEAGFHLVQLVEVQEGGAVDVEKLKPRARQLLLAEKGEDVLREFVRAATDKPGVLTIFLRLPETVASAPAGAAGPQR
jgi:peptidyl-prolyl cis-trans isomerase C